MFWTRRQQSCAENSPGSPDYAMGSEGAESVNRLPDTQPFEIYPGQPDIDALSFYVFVFDIYLRFGIY